MISFFFVIFFHFQAFFLKLFIVNNLLSLRIYDLIVTRKLLFLFVMRLSNVIANFVSRSTKTRFLHFAIHRCAIFDRLVILCLNLNLNLNLNFNLSSLLIRSLSLLSRLLRLLSRSTMRRC
jgi:hypothetical protein